MNTKVPKRERQKGLIQYIILFIILVVLIAVFDIDIKKIVEHPFIQGVWHYIKIIFAFIYSAFEKVFGEFQRDDVQQIVASSTVSMIK